MRGVKFWSVRRAAWWRRATIGCAAGMTASVVAATPAVAGWLDGLTTRVSVSNSGDHANGTSWPLAISGDGRFVAFGSYASNLVHGDTNGRADIFVRDRLAGVTSRVSVSSAGIQGNKASESVGGAMSPDGRFVCFESRASNLVPGDTNGETDVFVRDRRQGTTTRVSVGTFGQEGYENSTDCSMSADGRYFTFQSQNVNFAPRTVCSCVSLFVHDRLTRVTSRASVNNSGAQANDNVFTMGNAISADGRYVVFSTGAANLVRGDTNNGPDVFVRDRERGVTSRVSLDSNGGQGGTFGSDSGVISGDGRYVAFRSWERLVVDDANDAVDVYVRDRFKGVTTRATVNSAEVEANLGSDTLTHAMSYDGRYVVFASDATNLVPNDTNGVEDVFVRDRQKGVTRRISVNSREIQSNDDIGLWGQPLSADGGHVIFGSAATNLDAAGAVNPYGVFARDMLMGP